MKTFLESLRHGERGKAVRILEQLSNPNGCWNGWAKAKMMSALNWDSRFFQEVGKIYDK